MSFFCSVSRNSTARYSLFGDVVNTASRMESTSVVGAVHVSGAAWAQMDLPDELVIKRTLDIKGKTAPMDTMLLHSQSTTSAEAKGLLLDRWPQTHTPREQPLAPALDLVPVSEDAMPMLRTMQARALARLPSIQGSSNLLESLDTPTPRRSPRSAGSEF